MSRGSNIIRSVAGILVRGVTAAKYGAVPTRSTRFDLSRHGCSALAPLTALSHEKTTFMPRNFRRYASSDCRKRVTVSFADGQQAEYGAFWLRDHCKCPECWHAVTKQRLHDTFAIPVEVSADRVTVDGQHVMVTWSDGHQSVYEVDWLRHHSYDAKLAATVAASRHEKVLWNADLLKTMPPPMVNYDEVMSSDSGLVNWLKRIDVYGFCYVDKAPVDPKKTEALAQRIAFIRETHYGRFWDFTANLEHGDTAYTNLGIGAHTDSTYFTDPIGLQLFHLLEHKGEGGNTLLVDGFHLAQQLRSRFPDAFKVLSTTPVRTHSAGDANNLFIPSPSTGFPIIRLNAEGQVYQIRYNNHDRSAMPHGSIEQSERFYDALRTWHRLLTDTQNEFWTKMQPGRPVIVDNWRVLHGRSGFTGYRRLCGAYINWDDYQSRLSMLTGAGHVKKFL